MENFKRVSVIRKPILSYNLNSNCGLNEFGTGLIEIVNDCIGNFIIKIDIDKLLSFSDVEKVVGTLCRLKYVPYIHMNLDSNHKSFVYQDELITNLCMMNLPMSLNIIQTIPSYLIEKLSLNPFNILQFPIVVEDYMNDLYDLQECMYASRSSGLHTILRLEGIIPGVIHPYTIIDILNSMKVCYRHASLKFIEIPYSKKVSDISEDYLDEYFVRGDSGFICSNTYVKNFMKVLDVFLEPKKLSVSVCNNCDNCRGMDLIYSKKLNDTLYNPVSKLINHDELYSYFSKLEVS